MNAADEDTEASSVASSSSATASRAWASRNGCFASAVPGFDGAVEARTPGRGLNRNTATPFFETSYRETNAPLSLPG